LALLARARTAREDPLVWSLRRRHLHGGSARADLELNVTPARSPPSPLGAALCWRRSLALGRPLAPTLSLRGGRTLVARRVITGDEEAAPRARN
jgi:hypothetical protein